MHYDFKENTEISGFVYDTIENMHPAELEKIRDTIFRMREEEYTTRRENIQEWFQSTVTPVIIEIAQKYCGTLDVKEIGNEIEAVIRSDGDLKINLNTGRMRMVLCLANSLSIGTIGDEREVTFVFNKEHLMN